VECRAGEARCEGNVPQGCAEGRWESGAECVRQTCVGGSCVGECGAGEVRCSGNMPQRCDDVGFWQDEGRCVATAPVCSGGGCVPPSSCVGLSENCGAMGAESCCVSGVVPGGTFNRGNDGAYPATVSEFRLDRYEVTVGRFRAFVGAYPGSKPVSGAGAHPRIGGGGWDAAWDGSLPVDQAALVSAVKCESTYQTWTDAAGVNEGLPMNCVSWYVAFAFCAWDGGRLPTEAEWNYAAAGGVEQRQYPWSVPAGSTVIDGSHAVYGCMEDGVSGCAFTDIATVGSRSPRGDGLWGQSDLGGSLWEWTLDWYAGYLSPCNDCANLTASSHRVLRGGGWLYAASSLLSSARVDGVPAGRNRVLGVRCARTP
jgi:formylglycine-generating enzyme